MCEWYISRDGPEDIRCRASAIRNVCEMFEIVVEIAFSFLKNKEENDNK